MAKYGCLTHASIFFLIFQPAKSTDTSKKDNKGNDRKELIIRHSYLTYLKLLTKLPSLEEHKPQENDNLVYPLSHSLTQTDREYFNYIMTEDGHSNFVKRKRM